MAHTHPADTLHRYLDLYNTHLKTLGAQSLRTIWTNVFEVEGKELNASLLRLMGLVPRIRDDAERCRTDLGNGLPLEYVDAHEAEWIAPVVLPAVASGAQAKQGAKPVKRAWATGTEDSFDVLPGPCS